ncbi:MAG: DHHW family protein [Ruminococcus sp.]|nr:DHHW family protein [Ruminococcus sp.]
MSKREKKGGRRSSSKSYGNYFSVVTSVVTVLLFFGTLITVGCITLFSPKEDFSEVQNRYLAKSPKFTAKSWFGGSFMSGTEEFVSDHFPFHDSWIKLGMGLDMLSGRRELNGIYITPRRMAEKISAPDPERVAKSVEGIRKFAEENDMPVYLLIAPTQAEIYRDELPPYAPNPDQQQFIEDIYGELADSVAAIDVYGTLYANREDYIYYRTDHHWTTAGAFAAYTAAGKKMGYSPLGEESYDIEHAGDGFLGTFYSKSLWGGIKPDTLDIWLPTEGGEADGGKVKIKIYSEIGKDPETREGMYFREFLDVKDKYSVFFGTNQPMITVDTGRRGDSLLIFKDSYAHCFVPFLTAHYGKITMIDLRYINMSYKDIIDVSEYDSTLFLYNASTFMSDENLKKLNY